jgi:hypothetical protein
MCERTSSKGFHNIFLRLLSTYYPTYLAGKTLLGTGCPS